MSFDSALSGPLQLDQLPAAFCCFDSTGALVDCNVAWAKQLDIECKQEALRRFAQILPQYQPCDALTQDYLAQNVSRALTQGSARFELLCGKSNRQPIYLDITLQRQSPELVLGCAVEISQYKDAAHNAIEKECQAWARQRQMYDATPIPASLWDENHKLVDCNQALADLLEVSSKHECIERFFELQTEYQPCGRTTQEKSRTVLEQTFSDGHFRSAWTHRLESGEVVPIEIVVVRIDCGGRPMAAAYAQDLRPLRDAANKKRQAEERAQLILDTTPNIIVVYDQSHTPIDCNQEAVNMFGASSKSQFLDGFLTFMPPVQPCDSTSKKLLDDMLEQALCSGMSHCEFSCQTADGTPLPLQSTFVRMRQGDVFCVVEHATDLRPVKAAIQKERDAYELTQTLLDASPVGIEVWDLDKKLLDCNQKVLDMFGMRDKEEHIRLHDILSPQRQPDGMLSKEKSSLIFSKAMQGGFCRSEWMHLTVSGEPLPIDMSFVRIKYKGKPAIVCYNHDLRAIEAAMEREREANELNQAMLDACPVGIEIWDESKALLDCNLKTLEMFGLKTKDEFFALHDKLLPKYQPDGRPSKEASEEFFSKAFAQGQHSQEWMHFTVGGEPLPAVATLVRIERKGKDLAVGYNFDLRETLAARQKAAEAEERAKLLIEALPTACFLLDARLEAIDCNKAAIELFAKRLDKPFVCPDSQCRIEQTCSGECSQCDDSSRYSCTGRNYLIANSRVIFPGYEQNTAQVEQTIADICIRATQDGIYKAEFEFATIYGEPVLCGLNVVPVRLQGATGFAIYLQDLRGERRRELAEEESRAKTRFLARMSHEIRTPMNAVLGIAEIQLQKEIHPPDTEEAFLRIYSSSNLLLSIINDILDLSKVEAGKMEIVPGRYEMASLVVDTVQLNLMHIGSKIIDFALDVDPDLPAYLIGDELRLKQILNNLLSNAFKYTSVGGVGLQFGAERTDNPDEVNLVIRVSDTGQGMTDEQINSLFDAEFIRFNVEQNREVEGSGLGMSIAYQLIKMMRGDIHVQSEPSKGTVFTVCIPQEPDGDSLVGPELAGTLQNLEITQKAFKKMNKFAREPMPYGRVLVVDDVESNLYVIKGILMPYKLAVETVDSGQRAVEKIEQGNVYDIVFMDHMMPDIDGIQATRLMREMGYLHPIVALTANTLKGQAELFMQNGFSGFISKPIDINHLNSYLVRFIREKQPPEVITAARRNAALGIESSTSQQLSAALADSFLRDVNKAIEVLEPIALRRDFDDTTLRAYTIQAHAMKSALSNIGRPDLSKLASDLEQAGREEDTAIIISETPLFLSRLSEVVVELASREENGGEDLDSDPDFLRGKLLAISMACQNYDTEAADSTLRALREMPGSKKTKETIGQIAALLLHSEFEEAAQLAKRCAEELARQN